jgi:hypothetical protein
LPAPDSEQTTVSPDVDTINAFAIEEDEVANVIVVDEDEQAPSITCTK